MLNDKVNGAVKDILSHIYFGGTAVHYPDANEIHTLLVGLTDLEKEIVERAVFGYIRDNPSNWQLYISGAFNKGSEIELVSLSGTADQIKAAEVKDALESMLDALCVQEVGMKHRKAIKQGLLRNFGFMLFPFDMYDLDNSEDDILDDFFNSKIVDSIIPKHMFKTYTLPSIEKAIQRAFKRKG